MPKQYNSNTGFDTDPRVLVIIIPEKSTKSTNNEKKHFTCQFIGMRGFSQTPPNNRIQINVKNDDIAAISDERQPCYSILSRQY